MEEKKEEKKEEKQKEQKEQSLLGAGGEPIALAAHPHTKFWFFAVFCVFLCK